MHDSLNLVRRKDSLNIGLVGQITLNEGRFRMYSVPVALIQVVKDNNLFPFFDQLLNRNATNVPGPAGDKYFQGKPPITSVGRHYTCAV
jgi:hypothetical protein